MIKEADDDQSGEIEFKEFCMMMGRRMEEENKYDELEVVFHMFDKNRDDTIDCRDLVEVFNQLGQDVTLAECKDLVSMFDYNGDEKLQFDEFVSFMMPKH